MLRSIFFAALLALPMLASAEELHEDSHWRDCAYDENCVAIKGKCGMTAVNIGVKDDAVMYYRQEAMRANCTEQFWKPKAELVRCRLQQCEMYAKPTPKGATK